LHHTQARCGTANFEVYAKNILSQSGYPVSSCIDNGTKSGLQVSLAPVAAGCEGGYHEPMFGTNDLALFVASGLLLNFTPGPDTMYILGRTATQGWRGGAVAALGIGAGCFVHIFAAAAGLSALLAASATAFTVLKWIGAAYLVYVGVSMLRSQAQAAQEAPALQAAALRTVFLQGFLTNALNPKVALFFLAFLPQFIEPAAASKALAFVFLGLVFNINGTLWNLLVAWSAARIAGRLRRSGNAVLWLNRAVGAMFVYFGLRLAAAQK